MYNILFLYFFFFFFNDTATTEIYTLSLHDALPNLRDRTAAANLHSLARMQREEKVGDRRRHYARDRKSTRLNSSHLVISYAVFCLKKKKKYIDSSYEKTKNKKNSKK